MSAYDEFAAGFGFGFYVGVVVACAVWVRFVRGMGSR